MRTEQSSRVEVAYCPLCRSDSKRHADFVSVNEQGSMVHYRICERCGLVFQSPRMTNAALDDYYAAEYRQSVQGSSEPTEKDIRMQHARANHFLEFTTPWIRTVTKCLDVGSSTGILLETFRNSYQCNGVGIEPGEAYANFSREKGFLVLSDIKHLEGVHENSFDLITLGHTLEHIPDPFDFLKTLRERWLSPAGHILLEVPNLYGHHSFEQAHLIAFSKATLLELLRQTGFQVLKVRVHGTPRSRLIPLYITVLAKGNELAAERNTVRSSSNGVKARRKVGMLWRQIATQLLPRWAWLPWPEVRQG